MLDRHEDHVLFHTQNFRRDLREFLCDAAVDVPVAARFPHRVDRRGQRMDEGVHVRGVEIVLLVPARGRQDDVGIDAGGRHAEVQRDQQVELALRRLVMPAHLLRFAAARFAQILALHAMRRAEQVFEEIFVPLARGAEQVRTPDEHVARPVGRIVRIEAGHFQIARFEPVGHVILRLHPCGAGGLGNFQRVGLELRRGWQPAHAFGAGVVVDQARIPFALGRCGRKDVLHIQRLVAPLIGMRVEEAGRIHLAWRTAPVETESERQPAGLRAQLLLPDIVRPTATRLAHTTAHHQQVDDAAIIHVHVVPVVETGPKDDHRFAFGLFGIGREFTRHGDDLLCRNTGNLFGPGGRVWLVFGIIAGHVFPAKAAIETVIGAEQVEDACHQRLTVGELDLANGDIAGQDAGMIGAFEMVVLAIAEIGKVDRDDQVVLIVHDRRQAQLDIRTLAGFFLEVPLALFAPAEAGRAQRHHRLARRIVDRDSLPFGIVFFAQRVVEVAGAQQALRHVAIALPHQPHQHRHVGIFAAVILEIIGLPVEMEFAQDHMAHRQRQRRIGALLGVEPDVAELGRLRIVRADHGDLGPAITRLGHEMRIGCACLRHVGAPHHQEAGIVPVGAFGNVGLLAPGLRAGWRQVAIPVVERHAGAAEQREVTRTGRIGDHRHGRDRAEADHPVGAIGLGGIGIGRSDDFVHLVPGRTNEAAMTADRSIAFALYRILHNRGPGADRRADCPSLAPQLQQPRADHRIFQPLGGVEIPAIARPTRAAARFVIGEARPGARIVRLLRFPSDDPVLDVDLPAARSGAVHPVGGAHDLVVLPAFAIAVFPRTRLGGGNAVPVGKVLLRVAEEGQAVENIAHLRLP